MNRNAYVFAPPLADAPWRWCILAAGADPISGESLTALAALGDEAEQPAGATSAEPGFNAVILVLPGEDALAARVQVPTRSRRQMEAAIPYLVEEFVAEDIETLHLAIGTAGPDASGVPVHVLAPARLQERLDALAAAGLSASSARLDHDALPLAGGASVAIWIGASRVLVRTSSASFAVDRDQLTTFISTLGKDLANATTVEVGVSADADAGMLLAELEPLLPNAGTASVPTRELGPSLEAALAARFDTGNRVGLELLTGPFRPTRVRAERPRRWRLAAGLLLGWLLLQSGLDTARTSWLEARTEDLRAENLAIFQQLVPGRTRSPDPRRELEAMLGDGGTEGANFLPLLGVVAAEVSGLGGQVELRSINWNNQRGDLALDLSVPGIAQVDRFKAQLEAVGFPVTIDSAVQEQAGVRARIRVRGGADT